MNKVIFPSKINGIVNAPASKSFMQRGIALSVLTKGETIIQNPSRCDDALAGLNIASSFGCKVYDNGHFISIINDKFKVPSQLHCGESGLAIRLFTPIAALYTTPVELLAEGSLLKRPADFMTGTLNQLGVTIETSNSFPPVKVLGPIKPAIAQLNGSISSQFLSGLLIALPMANGKSVLKVTNLMSIPYVAMTLKAITDFGGVIENHDFNEFIIPGKQNYRPGNYLIEGDWSGAAGLLVAGAIAGGIQVNMLQGETSQADFAVIEALKQTGALVANYNNTWEIKTPDVLKPFHFDALHCPDLFPVLTALAANCIGTSSIKGVHRLIHKESNRGEALKFEFNKIGVPIEFKEDTMYITGSEIRGGKVFAHNDHRIAMALSLAALNATNSITIEGAECVNKTYPEFFADLQQLGVTIDSIN